MSRSSWQAWVWKSMEVGKNDKGEKLYAENGAMYPPKTKAEMAEIFKELRR